MVNVTFTLLTKIWFELNFKQFKADIIWFIIFFLEILRHSFAIQTLYIHCNLSRRRKPDIYLFVRPILRELHCHLFGNWNKKGITGRRCNSSSDIEFTVTSFEIKKKHWIRYNLSYCLFNWNVFNFISWAFSSPFLHILNQIFINIFLAKAIRLLLPYLLLYDMPFLSLRLGILVICFWQVGKPFFFSNFYFYTCLFVKFNFE